MMTSGRETRSGRRHLGPFLGGMPVVEGLRLTVRDAKAAELGELFLVHGHPGHALVGTLSRFCPYRSCATSFVPAAEILEI